MRKIRLVDLLRSNSKLILLSIVTSLAAVASQLFTPWIMKTLIDYGIPKKDTQIIAFSILGLVLIPIFSTGFSFLTKTIHIKIGGEITDSLRKQVFEKIIGFSPRTINQMKTGDLVGRITRSCGEVGDLFVKHELLPALPAFFMILGILSVMFYLNVSLTIVSLVMVPAVYLSSRWISKKTEQNYERFSDALKKGDIYFTELFQGIKTVQLFGRQDLERKKTHKWLSETRSIQNRTAVVDTWFRELLSQLQMSLGTGILFAFGIYQIIEGQLTIGSLIAFMVYVPMLHDSVKRIQVMYVGSKNVRPSLERIEELLNKEETITDPSDPIVLPRIYGGIEFRNVSFEYEEDRGQLNNLSFRIRPGEFIGIVGPTGGGKSTILDLILRFYDPQEGEVLVDGINVKEYSLQNLRSLIGLVTQDVFLWNQTIRENLLYANPEVTEEEIIEACKRAQIHDFIKDLPNGYDTVVGERGVRLSGGERQRLAIARVFLHKPDVLLLDEPTSALDAKTEAQLQKDLEDMYRGKTMIIVAHRLVTVQNADRIFVVDGGRIVEEGTHSELLVRKGVYYDLHQKQSM